MVSAYKSKRVMEEDRWERSLLLGRTADALRGGWRCGAISFDTALLYPCLTRCKAASHGRILYEDFVCASGVRSQALSGITGAGFEQYEDRAVRSRADILLPFTLASYCITCPSILQMIIKGLNVSGMTEDNLAWAVVSG